MPNRHVYIISKKSILNKMHSQKIRRSSIFATRHPDSVIYPHLM